MSDPIPADLDDISTPELEEMQAQITTVLARRWAAEAAPARALEVQAEAAVELDQIAVGWRRLHGGIGTPDEPVPWVAPTGAHDSWPRNSWVTHASAVWHNTHPVNSWEPGTTGSRWVRQDDPDPDTGHIAWAVGQDVKVGDERTHDGRLWRAKLDHQTHAGWAPSIHTHAVWADLGPYEEDA